MKIIYQAFAYKHKPHYLIGMFLGHCPHQNCVLQQCDSFDYIERANLVLFLQENTLILPRIAEEARSKQTWVLGTIESPVWPWTLVNEKLDYYMDATATYRQDSDILWQYGLTQTRVEEGEINKELINSKTKGAFAYVSNCRSKGYDRLGLMKELSKYVDVEIQGSCGHKPKCEPDDESCEHAEISPYHFYLSFENSLCTQYITEKFYNALNRSYLTVPVVVGGVSIEEYTALAPPNSFIHLYNFSSVQALGLYLKYLMENREEYMKYHAWRSDYIVRVYPSEDMACRMCELANLDYSYAGNYKGRVSKVFNHKNSCKKLRLPYS